MTTQAALTDRTRIALEDPTLSSELSIADHRFAAASYWEGREGRTQREVRAVVEHVRSIVDKDRVIRLDSLMFECVNLTSMRARACACAHVSGRGGGGGGGVWRWEGAA